MYPHLLGCFDTACFNMLTAAVRNLISLNFTVQKIVKLALLLNIVNTVPIVFT